jgi:hypothetical protein
MHEQIKTSGLGRSLEKSDGRDSYDKSRVETRVFTSTNRPKIELASLD